MTSPARWHLRDLRIGVRLRFVFACVLLFMLAGSAVSLWNFQSLRGRIRRVSRAEMRVAGIVRVNNSLLVLMSRLHRAADARQREYFETEANRLLTVFRLDAAKARAALRDISPESGDEELIVDSFQEMLDELPARIATLIELARADDWVALRARLNDQVDHTDDVAEALMQQADADLSQAHSRLSEGVEQAERQAIESLLISSLLGLAAAALLSVWTTRSITTPLAQLDRGARAIARGDFEYRVAVSGSDELANLGAVFDETAQKLARLYAQLRHNEAQMRLITDSLPVLISYVDREHRYVFNNQQHEHWFGRSRQQLAGTRVEEVMGRGSDSELSNHIRQALRGHSIAYETTLPHQRAGERRVRSTMIPDFDEQGEVRGFVSLVEDITADKLAEASLRESNEALRRANEDLNVFAFSASHDLQEPLRNISLYSQMLQRRYGGKLDSHAEEFIGYLVEGAGRMSELINDLLAYIQVSNRQMRGPAPVAADVVLGRAVSNLETSVIASGATITWDDLPALPVEPAHLQQLFQNLISNALKYRSAESPAVRISAVAENGYWEFSVKDNGIGVDPRYKEQIFKPFQRLHARTEYPGTGIGLAICQKIVERYGGRIWLESQPGEGSDFKFTLPSGASRPS